ncbi:MAG: hypothetical protein IPL33_17610 [Sphingobacteriales bacterium]|jgi:hypothetical protein|nr:hypothetical protein [Sphingobacteriales bacterium]
MRLTGFSRFLITLLVAGLLFFLVRTLINKFGLGKTTTTEQSTTTPKGGESGGGINATDGSTANNQNNTNASTNTNSATQSSNANRPAFSYTPPAPAANGRLRGVVELGSAGFNSFIIRMDDRKNWKLENAEFGASLVHESMATTDDIRAGLRKYIAKMADFGVQSKDIHFVVSSGAAKEPTVLKISDALKALKYVVNIVTPEQEGKFALKCVLPDQYRNEAFVVDIGSGNTKVSWVDATGKVKSFETHGAKYTQKGTPDSQVYSNVNGLSAQVPLANRKTCFIIGGVPYELAKQDRNGKERYTTLRQPDQYEAKGDKIKAGLNIYKAIADKTGCQTYVFDWDANFTIGFLLSL